MQPAFLCSNWNNAAPAPVRGDVYSPTSACFHSTLAPSSSVRSAHKKDKRRTKAGAPLSAKVRRKKAGAHLRQDEVECAPGCDSTWSGDQVCDTACNNTACQFDGGDCDDECAPGCPTSWIGDGYCNAACQNEACSDDGGDCDGGGMLNNTGTPSGPDCGDIATVPQLYVDIGVDADAVIFVLSSSACDDNVLAYASHCQIDHNDRPIFGYIQMCSHHHQPKTLPGQRDEDFHTAIHEITHILGMSSALFPYFRDTNNRPRSLRCPEVYEGDTKDETGLFYNGTAVLYWKSPYNMVGWCCADASWHQPGHPPFRCEAAYLELLVDESVVGVATVPSADLDFAGRKQTFLKTPAVVQLGKEHYGCDELVGVEVEDDGGPGTAGSHWEKRHLMNEFMAGAPSGFANKKSAFTLALLKDTGWYKVDYSHADPLKWGFQYGIYIYIQTRMHERAHHTRKHTHNSWPDFPVLDSTVKLSSLDVMMVRWMY